MIDKDTQTRAFLRSASSPALKLGKHRFNLDFFNRSSHARHELDILRQIEFFVQPAIENLQKLSANTDAHRDLEKLRYLPDPQAILIWLNMPRLVRLSCVRQAKRCSSPANGGFLQAQYAAWLQPEVLLTNWTRAAKASLYCNQNEDD